MADAAERTSHGFTQEQLDFLQETFAPRATQDFDRPTLLWLIGMLVALGLTASGFIWSELHSLRGEISSEFGSLLEDIRANGAALADLAQGLARIEAILEERLPRDR